MLRVGTESGMLDDMDFMDAVDIGTSITVKMHFWGVIGSE